MSRPPAVLLGIPAKEIARICQVDLSTAGRWKRGAICLPKTAAMILARDLGCFSAFWRGWTVNGEDLVSPEGWCVNRGDALAVPLYLGQISALRAQIRDLKDAELDGIEQQPEPGDIPVIRTG